MEAGLDVLVLPRAVGEGDREAVKAASVTIGRLCAPSVSLRLTALP